MKIVSWSRRTISTKRPICHVRRSTFSSGATVDGPSSPVNFAGLGTVTGMKACSAGDYRPFGTAAARYQDNVAGWPSVEPADDYPAASPLAFALGASGAGQ
jgi:hypothetical protein